MSRPLRALGLTATALLALTACAAGTGSTAGTAGTSTSSAGEPAAGAFPVSVTHAFGSTTIATPPSRVATVSWVNADVSIALGVVPVGMPKDEWGGNEKASTPWKDAALQRLGAAIGTPAAPAQYSEVDGINYTEIAKTTPDLILAAYSGLTREEYDKLAKIAPVVAYPKLPYGTPWQESTRLIGRALGKQAQAEKLVADTERLVREKAASYPQIKGKTFIYGNLEPAKSNGVNIYTANDNRPRFLTQIGMRPAPVVAANTKDAKAFFLPWSAERADELDSDVFVTWVPDNKTKAAIGTDPLLGQIPAVRSGALVADSDNTLTLSISASSPLSLPWALDAFLPMLGAAADKA